MSAICVIWILVLHHSVTSCKFCYDIVSVHAYSACCWSLLLLNLPLLMCWWELSFTSMLRHYCLKVITIIFVEMLCKWGGRYSLSVVLSSFLFYPLSLCCFFFFIPSLLLFLFYPLSLCCFFFFIPSLSVALFFFFLSQPVVTQHIFSSAGLISVFMEIVTDVVFHQKCTCIYRWPW